MHRRELLRLLLAGAAGLAFDPERLLWTPKPMVVVPAMPASQLTLLDWAKRLDPDGKACQIIELLNQSNDILEDLLYMEVPHGR